MWVEREGQFGNARAPHGGVREGRGPCRARPSGTCGCCMEVAHRVLDGETDRRRGRLRRACSASFTMLKDAHDFNERFGREVEPPAIWEEYRTFSNPDMNERAKAVNHRCRRKFEAKLKMEAKQLAPYDEVPGTPRPYLARARGGRTSGSPTHVALLRRQAGRRLSTRSAWRSTASRARPAA